MKIDELINELEEVKEQHGNEKIRKIKTNFDYSEDFENQIQNIELTISRSYSDLSTTMWFKD